MKKDKQEGSQIQERENAPPPGVSSNESFADYYLIKLQIIVGASRSPSGQAPRRLDGALFPQWGVIFGSRVDHWRYASAGAPL